MTAPGRDVQARVWALMAAVAEGRVTDVDPLLEDLDDDVLGDVVVGLAALALRGLTAGRDPRDPEIADRLTARLQWRLLGLAADDGPADGDG
ncbi:hypothetical protein [Streptomyces liliifuscus]|uniref:Uncharacterized protein n=1 Tax=Streptomyces liliifuscus TaxID=2797636 RepID=A0A7T7I856_9ACTN|nr:hypothetical protein [Streptomyces liliifuscus]QQM42818.1 hypothetical protein JEQ17_27610 [Streptomyces liliifuscus]